VIVRCTAKVLALLEVRRSSLPELESAGEDWYVNLLWVDRRKCLLATQAQTAFSVFVPDVRKADLHPSGSAWPTRSSRPWRLKAFLETPWAISTGPRPGSRRRPAAGRSG
jgi:hypothetical protein